MKKYLSVVASFILSLFLAGCVGNSYALMWVSENIKSNTKEVEGKSYTIGQPQKAFIGESVVNIKKFVKTDLQKDVFKPLNDFSLSTGSIGTKTLDKNDTLYIKGKLNIKDTYYTVLYNQKLVVFGDFMVSALGILVAEDGSFAGIVSESSFSYSYKELKKEKYQISPLNIKFQKTTEEKIKNIKSMFSYELIYTGKTADTIMLSYREYTGDDMARPAFFQNLTYSTKQKQIRFKNLLIEVISADNEKIVFKVLED